MHFVFLITNTPIHPLYTYSCDRCWGLRFTPADHDFLHQSHVFSNISKILSRSEEVLGAGEEGVNSMYESHGPVSAAFIYSPENTI